MTVYVVYTSFIILIIILFIISFYFILSLIYKKINEEKIRVKTKGIFRRFNRILNSNKKNLNNQIKALQNSFSNGRDIQSFYLAYDKYVKKHGYSEELRELLNKVVDYKKIMKSRVVRKSYRKSYTLYLISEFQLNSEEVVEMALNSLGDDSIYVRSNALHVISNQGKIESMLESLNKIDIEKKYYNDKTVIDFLDNFKGDKKKLDDEILIRLDNCSDLLKSLIIEHLTNAKNDDLIVKDRILNFLKISKNNELLIKSTRYFSQIVDERSVEYILENMDSESWSLRANSANAIYKYPKAEVIEKLKKTLGDPNYYVRKNSAESFAKIQDKQKVFTEAFNNDDLFVRDILYYTIETMGIEGFEEFKKSREVKEDSIVDYKTKDEQELDLEWT